VIFGRKRKVIIFGESKQTKIEVTNQRRQIDKDFKGNQPGYYFRGNDLPQQVLVLTGRSSEG